MRRTKKLDPYEKHYMEHADATALPGAWAGSRFPRQAFWTERHGVRVQVTRSIKFFGRCQCGWVSTTKQTEEDAAGAAVHHVRTWMKLRRQAGFDSGASATPSQPAARIGSAS